MESLSALLCFTGNIFAVVTPNMLSPLIRCLGILLNSGGPFPSLGITMQRGRDPSLFSVLRTCRNAARLRSISLSMRSMLSTVGTLCPNRNTIAGFIFLVLQLRMEMMARWRFMNVFVCLQKKEGFWVRHQEANLDIACHRKKPLSQKVLSTNFTKLAEAKTYKII